MSRTFPETFLTPKEAAAMKGVTRSTVYGAIRENRLPSYRVLKRLALRRSDVLAWSPTPHSGRPRGIAVTELARRRMAEAQKRRWAAKRASNRRGA